MKKFERDFILITTHIMIGSIVMWMLLGVVIKFILIGGV